MNKHIHIRDFDEAAHAKLVERAEKQGLSLSQYLRNELAQLASQPTMEELGERLRKIRGEGPPRVTTDEIVKIIHEGREEREQQLMEAIGSRSKP